MPKAKLFAKFWKSATFGRALGLHVEHADVEPLGGREIAPHVTGEACGDEEAVRDLRGVFDELAQHRRLALAELPVEVAIEGLAVDRRVGGDDLERGGVGGEGQVPVGVEGLGVGALGT